MFGCMYALAKGPPALTLFRRPSPTQQLENLNHSFVAWIQKQLVRDWFDIGWLPSYHQMTRVVVGGGA
jgi:hypothetical protein